MSLPITQGDAGRKRDDRLRVVFDMTFAHKSATGTHVYAHQVKAVVESNGGLDVISLAAPGSHSSRAAGGNWLSGSWNVIWMQLILPLKLAALEADLLHAPAFLSPLFAPCPVVLNVLDAIYLSRPQDYDYKWRLYARLLIGPAVRRAAAVITISEYSKTRIVAAYGVSRKRVRVIYPGVRGQFKPTLDQGASAAVRQRYGLGDSYCLFVGAFEKRKNLVALMEAVARLKATGRHPSLRLALVGPPGSAWRDVLAAIERENLGGAVICPGHVPDHDLPLLYAGAKLFVFPSLLEGFGLPLIEAMACGTPVVATPRPPIPEVVGGAALLAEGTDSTALAAAMDRVLSDAQLADHLRVKGLARARQFSWERAARETIAVYEQVVQEKKSNLG